MNKSATALSIMFIGLIISFLIFSILSIFYFYWGDLKAIQDSLSTTGSIFGGLATLGAAAVAAYLFNDWKDTANYQQNKEVIDEFWSTYIEVKIILVSLKDRAFLANNQSSTARIEFFDTVSTSVTKLYYLQQKVELYFDIQQEDIFWTKFEIILKNYIHLLDFSSTPFNQYWISIEAKLISDLNDLHSELYENLRRLNSVKD